METLLSLAREFALTFIPIFVAMDAIGALPIVLAVTQDMKPKERIKMIHYAMLTALGLGLAFVVVGKGIFLALGIQVSDFLVAGGLILLLFAVKDLLTGKMVEAEVGSGDITVGVVPIGTPLVVGPAVLTTLLILIDRYSIPIVLASFILNLAVAWAILRQGNRIARLLGPAGLKGSSKVVSLLLAAIAVKMIREGLTGLLG